MKDHENDCDVVNGKGCTCTASQHHDNLWQEPTTQMHADISEGKVDVMKDYWEQKYLHLKRITWWFAFCFVLAAVFNILFVVDIWFADIWLMEK